MAVEVANRVVKRLIASRSKFGLHNTCMCTVVSKNFAILKIYRATFSHFGQLEHFKSDMNNCKKI